MLPEAITQAPQNQASWCPEEEHVHQTTWKDSLSMFSDRSLQSLPAPVPTDHPTWIISLVLSHTGKEAVFSTQVAHGDISWYSLPDSDGT